MATFDNTWQLLEGSLSALPKAIFASKYEIFVLQRLKRERNSDALFSPRSAFLVCAGWLRMHEQRDRRVANDTLSEDDGLQAEFFKSSLLWLKSSVSSFRKFGIGILDTECEDWSYDPSGHPP